jgi:hypothetical protein
MTMALFMRVLVAFSDPSPWRAFVVAGAPVASGKCKKPAHHVPRAHRSSAPRLPRCRGLRDNTCQFMTQQQDPVDASQ